MAKNTRKIFKQEWEQFVERRFRLNWDRQGPNDNSNRTILDFGNKLFFVPVTSPPITVIVFLKVSSFKYINFSKRRNHVSSGFKIMKLISKFK